VTLPASACRLTHRSSVFKTSHRWTILALTLRLQHSQTAAPVTYRALADALGLPLGSRPGLTDAVAAVRTDRADRGLSLPGAGPDTRQAGSVFINPVVDQQQAAAIQARGGPIHTDQQGRHRASAGWLLQQAGYARGSRIAAGVYCSAKRTLTVVARGPVTSTQYIAALRQLIADTSTTTGIELTIEPDIAPPPEPAAGRGSGR